MVHHLVRRLEVARGGTLASVAPVRGPGFDRLAEVEPQ
jgi:hypothetical protein